ncbi:MAG TPA: ribosomal-processing cysteine protease Prp [Firmicutes bacterium]|jgi:hypothetical protein|nr:ribosomal-processing cysteine protease Prp [Bacillota bacterium]HBS92474.1 ribosomal-processing cysteine protease Prp [Bacillota bacterium]HCX78350.1 ribosomal-processing cysteine protease Prp [Bacillota bacterium]
MIEIKIFRDEQSILGFSASGHSDFSERGSDIVCSAISALSQTALLSLDKVAGVAPEWKRKDGLLECRLPADVVQGRFVICQVIFKTILTGIENIAGQYPDFVKVSNEEV